MRRTLSPNPSRVLAAVALAAAALAGYAVDGRPGAGGVAGSVRHLRGGRHPVRGRALDDPGPVRAYNGNLYQVRRSSDNATLNIGVTQRRRLRERRRAGLVLRRHDLRHHGHLRPVRARQQPHRRRPAGGAAGGPTASPTRPPRRPRSTATRPTASTSPPGTGYRDDATNGIATGDNPESEYAIFDGTHYNGGCCFDYGNAETNNNDDGNGTMEAIYFGNIKVWGYGTGNGPWIMADMENGLYSGVNAGYNANDPTTNYRYTTAMIEGGANQWAILGGNAQSGGLSTDYSGARPERLGLQPDEQAGRDHPRHRRRQQRGRRRAPSTRA